MRLTENSLAEFKENIHVRICFKGQRSDNRKYFQDKDC